MTNWKMPEWMREICLLRGSMSFVREAERARSKYPLENLDERERHLFSVTLDYENLHNKGFLLTPSERDEREKEMLVLEGRSKQVLDDNLKQQKRIAELEAEVERLERLLEDKDWTILQLMKKEPPCDK